MADDADRAADEQEQLLNLQLKARQAEGPKAKGHCLCCGKFPLAQGQRWCDAVCRDEWETLPEHKR